jgi:hypothetical protein
MTVNNETPSSKPAAFWVRRALKPAALDVLTDRQAPKQAAEESTT